MQKTICSPPAYQPIKTLYESHKTLVYRAIRKSDQTSVVVKQPKMTYPDLSELTQFRNQYNLTKNLDIDGIEKPLALEPHENGYILVMADTNAISLHDYIAQHQITLPEFFHMAIAMSNTLTQLHTVHITHKDIKPQNILINQDTLQVRFCDFHLATHLPKETPGILPLDLLQDTLAYISPEQTGRLNRSVDYRTDFYSLGVTFFELLTGQLPFTSTDPLEQIHNHLAKPPPSLIGLNAVIPQAVNDIILKLMAKNPEDRYQSATGLHSDLTHCQTHWLEKHTIDAFPLGQHEQTARFYHDIACDADGTEPLDLVNWMHRQLHKLPSNTQRLLEIAACINHPFQRSLLANITTTTLEQTALALRPALQQNIIAPISDANSKDPVYQFTQNRTQQIIYNTMATPNKIRTHRHIGQALKHNTTSPDQLFEVINQLNLGADLIDNPTERIELAELNLKIGRRAKASTAYGIAERYFSHGIALLKSDSWQTHYALTLNLHIAATEIALLNHDYPRQQEWAERTLANTNTVQDKTKIYQYHCLSLIAQNKPQDAMQQAQAALGHLNMAAPNTPHNEPPEHNALNQLLNLPTAPEAFTMPNLSDITSATYIVHSTIQPWQTHLRKTLIPLHKSHQLDVNTGDLHRASASASYHCIHAYFVGKSLTDLKQSIRRYTETPSELEQNTHTQCLNILHQVVINLSSNTNQPPYELEGSAYHAATMLPTHQIINDRFTIGTLYIHKMMLCYLFQQVNHAAQYAASAQRHLDGLIGAYHIAIFYFYDALITLDQYPELSPDDQISALIKVSNHQDKMADWAKSAPMNFQHKWQLIEAEKNRLQGHFAAAADLYDLAIDAAQAQEYQQEAALAQELAARFYRTWHKPKLANVYLTDAYYAYARWGAKAKTRALEQQYPDLRQHMSTGSLADEKLDLTSVMKASRTLSGELSMPALLEKMLDITMENAGAERCVMLLKQQGWRIEGESVLTPRKQQTLSSIALADYANLPHTLIQDVITQQRYQVLDDARDGVQAFCDDPYFSQHELKSVLCLPIHLQTKLIGLLYLENNLTVCAFHPQRLAILQVLSAQAAISIENALLYENLEEKVQQRTQELKSAQNELVKQAHEAGMMEMTASIIHNIGNALTPAKVDTNRLINTLSNSPFRLYLGDSISALPHIISETTQLADDEKQRLLQIVQILPGSIQEEYDTAIAQLNRIRDKHTHIESITQLQMRYAQSRNPHEVIDITTLLQDVIRIQQATLKKYHITLHTQFTPGILVCAEENKLLQTFINITTNGCHAMYKTPIEQRQLTLSTRCVGNDLLFSSQDNGLGFTPADKRQLFEFGYRTEDSTAEFGLYACASYLEAIDASIEVHSDGPNQGAQFVVKIPLANTNQ